MGYIGMFTRDMVAGRGFIALAVAAMGQSTALKFYYRFNRVQNNWMDDCPVHDPLAVLVAIDPSLVTLRKMRAHVECGGTYCRGMIVTDVREEPFDAPFTTFCVDVEGDKAVAELLVTFMDQTYAYPVD